MQMQALGARTMDEASAAASTPVLATPRARRTVGDMNESIMFNGRHVSGFALGGEPKPVNPVPARMLVYGAMGAVVLGSIGAVASYAATGRVGGLATGAAALVGAVGGSALGSS